jgi:UPF0755 protein
MSRLKIEGRNERVRARKRSLAALIVVLLLLSPVILGFSWYWYQIHTFGDPGKAITVIIKKGSGTTAIGDLLEDKGIVRSGKAFAIYTKISRRGPYQAGEYKMPTHLSADSAADLLEKGPIINYDKFTIIPGQRLKDIESTVGKLPRLSASSFEAIAKSGKYKSRYSPAENNNLEGLLLPETYEISGSETEDDLIRRSLDEFDARAQSNGLKSFNGLSAYQVVIVASLIEKEARYAPDRPAIASVIYNRLAQNMPLQIDATVLYGLGRAGGSLSAADLHRDTSFNTYLHKGLPPTPISMVSIKSLQAALKPDNTNYLYYVLSDKKTGKHAFAQTYEEHLKNIADAKARGDL